jgi:hypothetical protein
MQTIRGITMLRCFTVDRSGTLEEGQIISLVKYRDVEPHEVQIHVDSLFPDGVTSHGERYILSNLFSEDVPPTSSWCEITLLGLSLS